MRVSNAIANVRNHSLADSTIRSAIVHYSPKAGWGTPQDIDPGFFLRQANLVVLPDGTALAAWLRSSTNEVWYSRYE